MKTVEITIRGDVQGVGYRRVVERIARRTGVNGYVKNQKDGTVKVVAQADDEKVETFIKEIQIEEPPIIVERIDRKGMKIPEKYRSFKIVPGSVSEELQEGLGAGQEQLSLFRREFKDYRGEFKDYWSEFKDYRSEFKDYRSEFKDYRGEFRSFASRTDENFKLLNEKYGEISEKLTHILETLQKESAETRKEMIRAVDNLSKLVGEYINRRQP